MNDIIGQSLSMISNLMSQFGYILAIPMSVAIIGAVVGIMGRFLGRV